MAVATTCMSMVSMHLVTVMAGAIQAEEVVLLLIIGVRRAGSTVCNSTIEYR